MRLKSIILFCALWLGINEAQSQGLHFSQFQFSPLTVNPALAGAYSGTYRISGLFRDQYRSVATNAFQTLNFDVDSPIIQGFRKQDWIGIGLGTTVLDQAGAVGYKNTHFRLNAAYHLSLDKKQNSIFTIGLQMASQNVSIDRLSNDVTRLGLGNNPDIDIQEFNQSGSGNEGISDGFTDYIVGLMYNARAKDSDFKIGLSAARILGPELRLFNSNPQELDMRFTLFGVYTMQMNDRTSFAPALFAQFQGAAREIVAQGQFGYALKPERALTLNAGLGYRLGDAIQVLLGANIKDLRVGLAYDMNISSLSTASSYFGGLEFGVQYVGTIFKKPKIKPVIVCPTL